MANRGRQWWHMPALCIALRRATLARERARTILAWMPHIATPACMFAVADLSKTAINRLLRPFRIAHPAHYAISYWNPAQAGEEFWSGSPKFRGPYHASFRGYQRDVRRKSGPAPARLVPFVCALRCFPRRDSAQPAVIFGSYSLFVMHPGPGSSPWSANRRYLRNAAKLDPHIDTTLKCAL